MATTELEALLAGLGLARYLEEFRTEMIDDACLDSLEPEDMRALGLPIGPRRKLDGAAPGARLHARPEGARRRLGPAELGGCRGLPAEVAGGRRATNLFGETDDREACDVLRYAL